MRKVFFILPLVLLMLSCELCPAQDKSVAPTKRYYADTLTAAVDTIDVMFADFEGITNYTLSAYTTSGQDTVNVLCSSLDGRILSAREVVSLGSGTATTSCVITTTPQEWEISETEAMKIRLVCPDASATVVFVLNGKRYGGSR
jgi:hypothetical protein